MIRPVDSLYGQKTMRSPSQQIAVSRFMSRTYGWMSFGLFITAAISLWISTSENAVQMIVQNRGLLYGAMIAEVVLVIGLSAAYRRLSAGAAFLGFLAYAALNGVTLSVILLMYTMSSVSQTFLVTGGMFAGLAVFGTVTKKDLTSLGAFVGMGLWGLILVGIVNIFVKSESLSLGLSVVGVLVFTGLTAYDAQRIKAMAYEFSGSGRGENEEKKGAIFGALTLYLNFINLFLSLLRLFGSRRD